MESGWDGTSVRISYNKYPTLPGVILGLLKSADTTRDEVSSAAAEAVFPALDIIRRAGPPDEHREELRVYIEEYLGSKIWHVREIAARTLCSFFLQVGWMAEIGRLLDCRGRNANKLHGVLLTARFVMERKVALGYNANSGEPVEAGGRKRESLTNRSGCLDTDSLKSLLARLSQKIQDFSHCADIQAAYLEILNLLSHHGWRESSTLGYENMVENRGPKSSALLDMEITIKLAADSSAAGDITTLRDHLSATLGQDINTACRTLEATPSIWSSVPSKKNRSDLCNLYADICVEASAPEVRSQALSNLANLMGGTLRGGKEFKGLPGGDTLERVWKSLQEGEINPTLSYSIIQASGTFMAALSVQGAAGLERRLQSWGVMVADALDIDNVSGTTY